jgi:hypothetical protein
MLAANAVPQQSAGKQSHSLMRSIRNHDWIYSARRRNLPLCNAEIPPLLDLTAYPAPKDLQ